MESVMRMLNVKRGEIIQTTLGCARVIGNECYQRQYDWLGRVYPIKRTGRLKVRLLEKRGVYANNIAMIYAHDIKTSIDKE